MAWLRFGRTIISLQGMAYAALYALAKIPLYAKFIVKRQVEWIRTDRDGK
jgi:hypothetical protein